MVHRPRFAPEIAAASENAEAGGGLGDQVRGDSVADGAERPTAGVAVVDVLATVLPAVPSATVAAGAATTTADGNAWPCWLNALSINA